MAAGPLDLRCRSAMLVALGRTAVLGARGLRALVSAPTLLALATLAIFLFRPPDLQLHHLDRIALITLTFAAALRSLVSDQRQTTVTSVSLPLFLLMALAGARLLMQTYDPQAWSLFVAQFVVPWVFFHLATLAFAEPEARKKFDWFVLVTLAYLSFTAIASIAGATSLVFPRYILDPDLGIHADRARGPFLQAVANGVTLIVLGLVAIDCYRRRVLRGTAAFMLLAMLPVAILATLTRAVWLAFAGSLVALIFTSKDTRVRKASVWIGAAVVTAVLGAFSFTSVRTAVIDRAEEAGPVEIRAAIYRASWEMIRERPFLGWGHNQMPAEVAARMPDYDLDAYFAHNTYLAILVEHGILGIALYLWMIVGLFRLTARRDPQDRPLVAIWPIALCVYLFNALFVVMNYQFVNALLFIIAGMVAAEVRASRQNEYLG